MLFRAEFNEQDMSIPVIFGAVQVVHDVGETYGGAYVVTPQTAEQRMETEGKYMVNDVQIEAIPYAEVSNIFGGKTITIGG